MTFWTSFSGTRQSGRQIRDNEDEQLRAAIQASLQDTHRYPATPPGEDPALQSTIRESLRSSSQANARTNISRVPPQAGPNLGTTQQPPQEGARLYPRVPEPQPAEEEWGTDIQPSAPLACNHDNSQTPYPLHDTMPTPEDLRQRRLRRFER